VVGRYVALGEIALSQGKLREAQRHRDRTLKLTKRYGLTDAELQSFSKRIASIQRRLEEQARRRAEEAQRAAEEQRQLQKERERLRAEKARLKEQLRQSPPPALKQDKPIFIPPSF
jgi:chromosome segregation ATPase